MADGVQMTPKQQRFVEEYLIDLNATQAAIRAGYSEKTAGVQAHDLLKKPNIQQAINQASEKRAERTNITVDYVLNTIYETIERCKQAVPVLDKSGKHVMVETPDGEVVPAYGFDPKSVLRGTELLGKHLSLFTDKVEHSGTVRNENVDLTLSAEERKAIRQEAEDEY